MVAAIQEQAAKLATVAPQHANDARGEAAKRIVDLAPDGMNKVFFTNGGADANENAIRMARLHTGRRKVMSFYRSLPRQHRLGDRRHRRPAPRAQRVRRRARALLRPVRLPLVVLGGRRGSRSPSARSQHLEQVITFEGPASIAAILIETVVGTAGVLIPPPGYLEGVRALCDKHGIMLILDEVMAGFGRCGTWFAFENFGVTPDLITFAKGSNSGYVPVGGVIISDPIAATFDDRVFPGGLTYSGHPLACASIVASIDAMKEEGIVENAQAHRRGRPRPRPARARRAPPRHRRGPRPRRVLGARPRDRPRDPRAARAVRRILDRR